MIQARQNCALAGKPLGSTTAHERRANELECDLPFKQAIGSFREPDASHAAHAEL
jgi:hypothetical protein